ncbi:zinc ribbon domain-containing protein [Clostridium sp. CX1]|uniref:zinc ribbon domain-containing protein n=1 Tax=Clostridium sp. CX1 TaxID=2978346 RepID=UPI0021BE48F2|nr:zinc ribbon domain-containing protein [Clostridium sp. CX1]MCT8978300.1 zinc ribbon domain-containing protein [Clostridium sp. CX1]
MQTIAYRCLECGHYTISKRDGIRCAKCGSGATKPMNNATYIDKNKELSIDVRLKDTKIFRRMLDVFLALMDDRYTPDWIKERIQRLVLDEIKKD